MNLSFVPKAEFRRIRSLPLTPVQKAALFADACRLNVLYMVMRAGSGHLGSSFSCLDLVAWIYLNELNEGKNRNAVYFSSKGHDVPALYSVLTALGLLDFDKIHRLRVLGGLPGHPDIGTPGIVCNTGSLGMGVSKAKGMALAARLRGRKKKIFVLCGDGELQEGQFWESLVSAANRALDEIVLIVDHNQIQSDTWVKRVSDLGALEQKFKAFGWDCVRCNGHDFNAIKRFVGQKAGRGPRVILADTLKGKGVSFMEPSRAMAGGRDRLYRFHSGAPSFEEYEKALKEIHDRVNQRLRILSVKPLALRDVEVPDRVKKPNLQSCVEAYSKELARQGSLRKNLVVLDADLAKDCGLLEFERLFPRRYLECGIAEQDMVSQAGALARNGFLPVVHFFASFFSTRANEQIFNNATERSKIIYVGTLAGLLPAAPGHSHQALRDISVLGSVPGLTLLQPADEAQTSQAIRWAVTKNSMSSYLRLSHVAYQTPFNSQNGVLRLGIGSVLRGGSDAVFFAYGPVMLSEVYRAAAQLQRTTGFSLKVVNLPWLNVLDRDWLRRVVGQPKIIFTLDDHAIFGGQGRMIASAIAETGIEVRVVSWGIEGIAPCGQPAEVMNACGLDAESLTKRIRREARR